MDFSLTENQQELTALDRSDPRRPHDAPAPQGASTAPTTGSTATRGRELAKANLLGIALPESHGGLGFGFLDLCLVLQEVGRHVAPLPVDPDARVGARCRSRSSVPTRSRRCSTEVVAGDVDPHRRAHRATHAESDAPADDGDAPTATAGASTA